MIDNTLTLLGGENSRKLLTAIEEAIFNDLVANDETPERLSSQDDFSRITGLLETLVELQTSAIEKDVTLERIATIPQVIQTNDQNILNSNIIKLGLTAPFNNLIDVIKNLDVASEGDFERTKKFLETVDISNHTAQRLLKILKLTENDLATSDSTSQIVKNKIVQFEKLYKISKTRVDAQIESLSQLKTLIANVTQSDTPDYTNLNQLVNLLEQFDLPQNLMAIKTSIQKIIESEMVNKPDDNIFKTIETNPIGLDTDKGSIGLTTNTVSSENVSTATDLSESENAFKTIASDSDRILKTIAKTSTNNELSESKSDLKTSESDSIETNSIPIETRSDKVSTGLNTAKVSTSVPEKSQLTSYQNGSQSETLIKRFITASSDLVRSLVKSSSRSNYDGIKTITETNSSPVEPLSERVYIQSDSEQESIGLNIDTTSTKTYNNGSSESKSIETNVSTDKALNESENTFKTIANESDRILKTIETNSIDSSSIEPLQDSIGLNTDKKSVPTDKVSTNQLTSYQNGSQSDTLITRFITTTTDFIRSMAKSSEHRTSDDIKTNAIHPIETTSIEPNTDKGSIKSDSEQDSIELNTNKKSNENEDANKPIAQNLNTDHRGVLDVPVARIENQSGGSELLSNETTTTSNQDFKATSTIDKGTGIIQRFITATTGFIQTVVNKPDLPKASNPDELRSTPDTILRDSTNESNATISAPTFETNLSRVDTVSRDSNSSIETNSTPPNYLNTTTNVLKEVTSATDVLRAAESSSILLNSEQDTRSITNQRNSTSNESQRSSEFNNVQSEALHTGLNKISEWVSETFITTQAKSSAIQEPLFEDAMKIESQTTETIKDLQNWYAQQKKLLEERHVDAQIQNEFRQTTSESFLDMLGVSAIPALETASQKLLTTVQEKSEEKTEAKYIEQLEILESTFTNELKKLVDSGKITNDQLKTLSRDTKNNLDVLGQISDNTIGLDTLNQTIDNMTKTQVEKSQKVHSQSLTKLSKQSGFLRSAMDVVGLDEIPILNKMMNVAINRREEKKRFKLEAELKTKQNAIFDAASNLKKDPTHLKGAVENATKGAVSPIMKQRAMETTTTSYINKHVNKALGIAAPKIKPPKPVKTLPPIIPPPASGLGLLDTIMGVAGTAIGLNQAGGVIDKTKAFFGATPASAANLATEANTAAKVTNVSNLATEANTASKAATVASEASTISKVANVSNLATEANTASKIATVASEAGTIAEVGAGSKAMGFAKGLGGVASKLAAPLMVASTVYNNMDEIAEKGSIQASSVFNKLGTNLEDTFSLSDSLFSFKRFGGALGVLGNVTADIPMMVGTKVGELARGATNAIIGDKTTTSMADSFFGFFTGKSNNEAAAFKEQEAAIKKFNDNKEIADKKKAAELESEKKREAILKAESEALKTESETLNPKAADLVETPSTGLNTTTQLENKSIEPQSNKGSIETSNVSNTADIVNQKSDSNLTKSNSIDYQSDKKSNDFTSDKNSIDFQSDKKSNDFTSDKKSFDTSQKMEVTGIATRYTPDKLGEYTGTDNEIAAQKEQAKSIERFNKYNSDIKTKSERDLKSQTEKDHLLKAESEILRTRINNNFKTVETGLTSYQNGMVSNSIPAETRSDKGSTGLNTDNNTRTLDSIQGFTRTSIDNNSDKKSIQGFTTPAINSSRAAIDSNSYPTNKVSQNLKTGESDKDSIEFHSDKNSIQGFTRTSINDNSDRGSEGISQNLKTGEIQRFTRTSINNDNSDRGSEGISQNLKTGEIQRFTTPAINNSDKLANDVISLKTGEPVSIEHSSDKNSTGFTRFNKLNPTQNRIQSSSNQSNSNFNDLGESQLTSYQNGIEPLSDKGSTQLTSNPNAQNDNPYLNVVSLQDSDRLAGQTLNTTKLLNDTLQQMSLDVSPNVTQPPPVVINAPTTSRSSGGEKISGVQAPMYTHNDDSTLRTIVNQMFAKTFV